MSISKRRLFGLLFLIVLFVASPALAQSRQPDDETSLTFTIVADQRYYTGPGQYDTSSYFRGALEAIDQIGVGAFLVSPGDIDPPALPVEHHQHPGDQRLPAGRASLGAGHR